MMLRLLLYITALLAAAAGLSMLAEIPGTLAMEWMGWHIETSLLFALFVVGVLVMAVVLLYVLLATIFSAPRRYRRARRIENHERGLSALTEAFAALAVSDVATARKLNRRAEKILGAPPITHLLAAQLARLENDKEATIAHLLPLMEHKETRFLAARGLLEQARHSGDIAKAITYAEEAGHIRPDSSFAAISLIDLYTREQRWQQAQDVIRTAKKHRALSAAEAKRYLALIDYQHGLNLYAAEDYETALPYAKNAHKTLPDMVPAALLLVRCHAKTGQKRQIPAIISRTWKHAPHPSLALMFKKCFMDESPARRLKRIEALTATNPQDIESQIAVADAALDDGQFDKARNHLKIALAKQETPRVCKLMARLEETRNHDREKAEEWAERSLKAHKAAVWTCDNCKTEVDKWALHCPECGAFDAINWQTSRPPYVDSPKTILPPV